jgi:hypothetical protein
VRIGSRFAWIVSVLAVGLVACGRASACGEVLRGEAVTIERSVFAPERGKDATMHVLGAGWIHAVEIVKTGGRDDSTYVTFELDGQEMITTSFARLKDPWNQIQSPNFSANVTTVGDKSTMTIWYLPELKFKAIMALRIDVQEEGIDNLQMRAMMNKPAPHEHVGQQAAVSALPAFK